MKSPEPFPAKHAKGFTVLELLVAVAVTAMLGVMLLTISNQVINTHGRTTADLETNDVANYVLDRIQEDLHCALYRNDGGVWMAATILPDTSNSGEWKNAGATPKPATNSLRLTPRDWPEGAEGDAVVMSSGQLRLADCRFGPAGTWFRFFAQPPQPDTASSGSSGARAISYQIVRHGLTGATASSPRYQLFRNDVSTKETFDAGYDLHPDSGAYAGGGNGPRQTGNVVNPIFTDGGGRSTDFCLAANVIDFGIRAYVIEPNSAGQRQLLQIFPDANATSGPQEYLATSTPAHRSDSGSPLANAFPDVIDVMVRILTHEGSGALAALEEGLVPPPSDVDASAYWWQLAEQHSRAYVRRIRILPSGL